MSSAALALQKAIVAALIADPATGALVGDRIYDAPPRDSAFPYVTLGDTTATDWSTGDTQGQEHRVTVLAWSRERGKRECHEIVEAVRAALHDAALTLDGQALANLRFEFADVRREADGITYRGLARFRAVTEPE